MLAEGAEEHVHLPGEDMLCEVADYWCVKRDLHFEQSQDVVYRVEAGDWCDRHEISHMYECLGVEHLVLGILVEQVTVLDQISWQVVVTLEQCLQVQDQLLVFISDLRAV